jgi:hypothetical protein
MQTATSITKKVAKIMIVTKTKHYNNMDKKNFKRRRSSLKKLTDTSNTMDF